MILRWVRRFVHKSRARRVDIEQSGRYIRITSKTGTAWISR